MKHNAIGGATAKHAFQQRMKHRHGGGEGLWIAFYEGKEKASYVYGNARGPILASGCTKSSGLSDHEDSMAV